LVDRRSAVGLSACRVVRQISYGRLAGDVLQGS